MKYVVMFFICMFLIACQDSSSKNHVIKSNDKEGVIYGSNDIKEEYSEAMNSLASVALINKRDYQDFSAGLEAYSAEELTGVTDFEWAVQASLSFCSGVLIKPDLVLTAGHCIENIECDNFVGVIRYDKEGLENKLMSSAGCQKIEGSQNRLGQNDWALIRLDRALTNKPVKLATQKSKFHDKVYSIGYPLGTAKKYSQGQIRFIDINNNYQVNLDAFVGQSGSPVFDSQTNELIGVLSSGEEDPTDHSGKMKVKYCADAGCKGETIISILNIPLQN